MDPLKYVLTLDIDECSEGSYKCHVNATCINIKGGYNCSCKEGYTGDGNNCTGMFLRLDDQIAPSVVEDPYTHRKVKGSRECLSNSIDKES